MRTRISIMALGMALAMSAFAHAQLQTTSVIKAGALFEGMPFDGVPLQLSRMYSIGSDQGWTIMPGGGLRWEETGWGFGWGEMNPGVTSNQNGRPSIHFAAQGKSSGPDYLAYEHNLIGYTAATLSADIRALDFNNGGWSYNNEAGMFDAGGIPLLSVAFKGEPNDGMAVSLCVVNQSTNTQNGLMPGMTNDDSYKFMLVQYSFDNRPSRLVADTGISLNGKGESDFHNWSLSLDRDGHVICLYDGVEVVNTMTSPYGDTLNYASFGAGTVYQNIGSNAKGVAAFDNIILSSGMVPEPASLCLLAVGAVALLRRR